MSPPARLRVHGGEKSGKEVDLPSEVEDLVHAAHTALVETVVETDDDMMEAYFEGKEPSREQIVATIHTGIVAGDIQPVLVASAERSSASICSPSSSSITGPIPWSALFRL